MTLTYVTGALNHHISALCEAFFHCLGDKFTCIATEPVQSDQECFQKGYAFFQATQTERSGMLWYKQVTDGVSRARCQKVIDQSDVVIIANTTDDWVFRRLGDQKLTFRAHERWFRKPLPWYQRPRSWFGGWIHHRRFPSLYMLCASAYTAADTAKVGCFKNKTYCWGYFPEQRTYAGLDALFAGKNKQEILWCGRMLDWKHPEDALKLAERLAGEGRAFHMTIAGTGPLEDALRKRVSEVRLADYVSMPGSLPVHEVRERMEQAGIYLITSDFCEGWGAVLNEAMNSGCAVVTSHAIGAAPYLIKDETNGFLYKSGRLEELCQRVGYLLDTPLEQKRIGEAAYQTIAGEWNAAVAAERFIELASRLINGEKRPNLYHEGPCARAAIIPNEWYE